MSRALFLGSSTTYGLWGREGGEGGYPDMVDHYFMDTYLQEPTGKVVEVHKAAWPTQQITEMAMEFRQQTTVWSAARKLGRTVTVAMPGCYDHATYINDEGVAVPMTTPIDFHTGLGAFICNVLGHSTVSDRLLILMEPPPLAGENIGVLTEKGELFRDQDRRRYAEIVRRHAAHYRVPFIEIYDSLGGPNIEEAGCVSHDGVHLNGRGHRIIFERLLPTLLEKLHEPIDRSTAAQVAGVEYLDEQLPFDTVFPAGIDDRSI